MDTAFPIGLPTATAWYAALYVLTLVMHVVFMNYVLAGTLWLAAGSIRRRIVRQDTPASPVLMILKDWMPFALSAAITAGIAPLLFVQILYQREFYTANLLLFHRWMAILPVLIVVFYLLYLLKARRLATRPTTRTATAVIVAACVLFIAYSWTENHILGLNEQAWPGMYGLKSMLYRDASIVPRLSVWVFGAFPTLAVLVGWQLRWRASGVAADAVRISARPLATAAITGLLLAMVSAAAYGALASEPIAAIAKSPLARPYFFIAAAGVLTQLAAWLIVSRNSDVSRAALAAASVGLCATVVAVTVVRECVRLSSLQLDQIVPRHEAAATAAGKWVFLGLAIVAIAVVISVVSTIARAQRSDPSGP